MTEENNMMVYQGFSLGLNGNTWYLKETYRVLVGSMYKLVCPKYMSTDGASIPRFFWRIVGHPMTASYVRAAVIHDAGYANTLEWSYQYGSNWVHEIHGRKETDQLFLMLMKDLKVSWWRRNLMYLAVRWFGRGNWTER